MRWAARTEREDSRTQQASASRRSPRFISLGLLGLALGMLAFGTPSAGSGEEREGVPAFRRQLLPADRLPQELKRVQDGVLHRLPVSEFDALVERATRANLRRVLPRLLEARYHAVLKGEALSGEGQWKVRHKGPGPGLLNLEPLSLALRHARFENGDALIAAFDGKKPALLVEAAGVQTVSLDWSARAETGPEGLQFRLEVPSCPIDLLELDVPVGRTVTLLGASDDSLLLSGPHPAETAELRRWKIAWRGRDTIDFRIGWSDRPSQGAEQPSAPFVVQKTTQKLHPEGLDATFELTLSGLAQGVRELVCECDPILRLRDVVGPHVDGCSFQVGGDNKPSRLTIRLREAVRAGTWQIVCLAPLSTAPPVGVSHAIVWRSPGLRLVGGVPRGETLTLWLHPDLRVESWDPGSFRLTSINNPDMERPPGAQNLILVGGGLRGEGPATAPRRPEARLQAHGVEFRAHQLAWWRCDAAGMSLTTQIGWEVSQGQLYQLTVLLPSEWAVERVEMSPANLLHNSRVRNRGGRSTLYVDLTTPLTPHAAGGGDRAGEEAGLRGRLPTLTVTLRPGWSGPTAGRTLSFPDPIPLGARFREGALALDCDEQLFRLEVQTKAERSEPDNEGPWGPRLPAYYYLYRGQPLSGKLAVQPRPPRLRATCRNEVFVASGLAAVTTHLQLEAEVGSPESVDLSVSAAESEPWQWVSEPAGRSVDASGGNRLRGAERLHGMEAAEQLRMLAARDPLQAAILFAAPSSGERWRLTFARPLRSGESLRLRATRKLQPRVDGWHVPLPVVPGPGRMEGEVKLHLAGGELVQVHSRGLSEAASSAGNGATPWRTFRYGSGEVSLRLSGQARAADRAAVAVIDRARLVTYLGDNGHLQHHFCFRVANWDRHTLPVRLPAGSRPLAIQVDGRWLPRLIPAASVADNDESAELGLPVPGREEALPAGTFHRYEIVYARNAVAGWPWLTLDAPAPILPVSPLAFRRVWRLPPNWVPLHEGNYQAVPGTHGDASPPILPRQLGQLFHLPGVGPEREPLLGDAQADPRAALAQAVEALRGKRANQTILLRDAVAEIAFTHLQDRYPFVIDTLALRDAGITAESRLEIQPPSIEAATPPWEPLGLVAVPTRSSILLTTTSGRGAGLREPFSDAFEYTLAAASMQEQDASGRFRSALSWLRPRNAPAGETASAPLPGLGSDRVDWSEWEPVAGLADDRLTAVRRDEVTGAGYGLAVLLALGFWLVRRRTARTRLILLILTMAFAGLATFWLPTSLRDLAWWPLLATGLGALVWYFKAVLGARSEGNFTQHYPKSAATGAAATGLFLLVLAGWDGRAAAPMPATVYLIPGPAEAPENQTVLVPTDLLERLKALGRPSPLVAGGPRAVLLDSVYEGKLAGNQAEFTAVFSIHCVGEEPATLAIPLDGVQLAGTVWLDGAPADPLALPAPQVGYSLKVRGRGRHKVELRFRAPVVGTPEDRNVLFTVPPLVRSRLIWHTPAGGSAAQILVKQGAQWSVREDRSERLEADLGRLPLAEPGTLPRPVHLHWYQPLQPGRRPRLQYRAAYLWDLNVEASYLTAWLRYHVLEGAVQTLEVDLPAELEVRSASVRRPGTVANPSPPWLTHFRLRDWYVTTADGKRVLHLEFPYPITGGFQIALELAPRTPLPPAVTLALPSPRGERSPQLHYLAYRTQLGLDAQRDTPRNITRIPESDFAPDWPGVPRLFVPGKDSSRSAAYRISPDQTPVLRLHLRRGPPVVQAKIEARVQAGIQRAEIQVLANVTAPNKDLAAIEWDLRSPHLTIASVTGEDVRAWKQSDQRVLVWLNRTTGSTRIRLSGWLPVERRDGRFRLDLLGPRLIAAREQNTQLHLMAATDLALASVKADNLTEIASPPGRAAERRERTFQAKRADYGLHCEIQPVANAIAHVLTLAEVNDRRLHFTTIVDYEIPHGELRRVELRLKNWEQTEKLDLQAEHEALRRGPIRTPGGLSWQLSLQPGITGRYRLTLRGSLSIEDAAVGVPMPDVTVQGVESAEYLLAVAGGELTAEARNGLVLGNNPANKLARWPGAAERVERTHGQVWQVQNAEWQLRLLPHARALESAPVRVFLLEQSAAVVDGSRWMHEARCWLRHEAHTDLNIDFAAPARVVAASVDGAEVTPLQPGSARLWLPLPGRAGVRCVRLRWLYDQAEPLERPNLTPPQVVDALSGALVWTVRVPPGWDVTRSAPAMRLDSGPAREASLALYRAETQLHICQELSRLRDEGAASVSLTTAQRRFALYCRHARCALGVGASHGGVRSPDGKMSLTEWLDQLQAENRTLASQGGFEAVRAEAERRADAGELVESEISIPDEEVLPAATAGGHCDSLPHSGTPISWPARAGAEPPAVQLTSHQSQQTRHALSESAQWLSVLAVVWIISFVPFLLARMRLFWPEQVALLGLLGWYLVGPTLIVLGLLLAAVAGRISLLAAFGYRLSTAARRQPATESRTPVNAAPSRSSR